MDETEPLRFLKANIELAKTTGNIYAVRTLRSILVSAAYEAPVENLIAISQCLLEIGLELRMKEIEKN